MAGEVIDHDAGSLGWDGSDARSGGVVHRERNVSVGSSARRELHISLVNASVKRVERHGELAALAEAVSGLAKGVYVVKIIAANSISTYKVQL